MSQMYELSEIELDAVAAGQQGLAIGQIGLVNVGAQVPITVGNISVSALNGNTVTLTALNGDQINVGVGAALAILGGAGVGLTQGNFA